MKNKQQQNKPKPPVKVNKPQQKKATTPKSPSWLLWALVAGIVIVTFISFTPALKNDFTNWDDDHYVSDNHLLAKPTGEAVKYFFSNFYFSNYIPLTMILYTMEYHATEINPATNQPKPEIFHTTSVVIHCIDVMMVFWFIFLLSGRRLDVATIVALFFGIHPMHVESVAWVAELKDVLYTFFFMGGLIAYYKYISNKEKKPIMLLLFTLVLFTLSGLSKPAATTFPLSLIVIDFYCRRKFTVSVWLEKVPFFIGAIIFGYLTYKAQVSTAIAPLEQYSLIERFMLASYAMLDYIAKLFVPINLAGLHPYPHQINGHLPTIYFITPVISLGLFILVWWSLKFSRLVFFGFLFFLANIILVLQFLSVGLAITSDRYSYVPYIGLFFIIAMGYNKLTNSTNKKLTPYKPVATVALVIFGFVFCIATYARCQVWKNNETMWTDVIAKYPNDYLAYDNRGVYYRSIKRNDLALADYNMVVKNNPKYALGFNNRGNIYFDAGQDSLAFEDYNHALALDSGGVRTYTNRALIYSRRKQNDLAERDFHKAYLLDSNFDRLYFNRGIYYDLTDQEEKALADFHKYLTFYPKDDGIVNSCGVALQKLHKYEESIPEFTKAIELNPKQGAYYLNRSISENMISHKDKAKDDAISAQKLGLKIDPAYLKIIGLQ